MVKAVVLAASVAAGTCLGVVLAALDAKQKFNTHPKPRRRFPR